MHATQILLDASFCTCVVYNAAEKSAAHKLIPRAGNARPENGTYRWTRAVERLRSITLPPPAEYQRYYAAAAFFFDFFSAPADCSSSFLDLRAFFSTASSIS